MNETQGRRSLDQIRILAIDPGSRTTGWAQLVGNTLLLNGNLKLPGSKDEAKTYTTLNYFIRQQLEGMMVNPGLVLKPNYIVLESFFTGRMRGTTVIPELRGVIKLAAYQVGGVKVVNVAPGTVKKYVTGSGRASKNEVRAAICKKFNISIKSHDEADAIAIGLTGLSRIVDMEI